MSSVQYLIGKTLNKYEVLEHIGHGGMSEVYCGQQAQLDRKVAIKVLHPFLADEEGFVVRFQREARIVATLRHPNIVQVYDFDYNEELDIYFMVMEFIDGPTLKNRLEEGPLPPEETAYIGAAVADALNYAHRRGMVHRDIKPANIMFLDGQQPVLTDFGIAKMLTLSGLTASGAMVGTPAYMAPEIGLGKPGTALSDIYSLSVVLYQTTTGCLPFTAETPMGMVMQHINKEPPRPSLYNASIPGELEEVILRGLQKEPEKRYRDAAEMASALHRAIGLSTNGGLGDVSHPSLHLTVPDRIPTGKPVSVSESNSVATEATTAEKAPALQDGVGHNDIPEEPGDSRVLPAAEARAWSPWSHQTIDDDALDTDGAPIPATVVPQRGPSRLWRIVRSTGLMLIVMGLTVGGWYNLTGNSFPAIQNLSFARAGDTPVPAGTQAVEIAEPTATATELPPEPTATRIPLLAAVADTPTAVCSIRIRLDEIDVQPDAVISPGTSVVAYITVRNSGTCAWPQATKMIFAEGDLLDAPESFPVAALRPGEKLQFIVPMTAPEDPGTYQTVWELRNADGGTLGAGDSGRIAIELTVEDTPAGEATPLAEISFEEPARIPLTVTTPTLLSWDLVPSRDLWTGAAMISATGGSGIYTYYLDRISAETQLYDGILSFEWRNCEPYPFKIWILSGAEILDWKSSIAYPDIDRCP